MHGGHVTALPDPRKVLLPARAACGASAAPRRQQGGRARQGWSPPAWPPTERSRQRVHRRWSSQKAWSRKGVAANNMAAKRPGADRAALNRGGGRKCGPQQGWEPIAWSRTDRQQHRGPAGPRRTPERTDVSPSRDQGGHGSDRSPRRLSWGQQHRPPSRPARRMSSEFVRMSLPHSGLRERPPDLQHGTDIRPHPSDLRHASRRSERLPCTSRSRVSNLAALSPRTPPASGSGRRPSARRSRRQARASPCEGRPGEDRRPRRPTPIISSPPRPDTFGLTDPSLRRRSGNDARIARHTVPRETRRVGSRIPVGRTLERRECRQPWPPQG